MQKISASTTTADTAGEFTEGNSSAGIEATQIKAAWLNSVQRELIGLLIEAGLTPKADDDTQLRAAVKAIARAISNSYGIGGAAVDVSKMNLDDAALGTITRFEGSQTDAQSLNYPVVTSTGTVQINFETLTYGMDGRVIQQSTEVFGAGGMGRGRTFYRVKHDSTWFAWREVAMLDSPMVGARTAEVVFFPSTSAPVGFLKANGAAISRTAYAALYAVIGTNYGNGDGSTTFNLPDLRGEFLRGWDDGRGVDSGRALHSSQGSQNLSHNHSASASNAGAHTHTMTFKNDRSSGEGNAVFGDEAYYSGDASQTTSSAGDHTHTISIGASGGNEARPRNIALLACIKY